MVKRLVLPSDILDYICSFIFYQEIDVLIRKYNIVLSEFKRVRKTHLYHPNATSIYYILHRGNQLIVCTLCSICGNYVKPTQHKFICQCI